MKKWLPTFSCVPINYNYDIGTLRDLTQEVILRNNLDGTKMRIRFCNLYNREELRIAGTTVILRNRLTGKCSPETVLTLQGETEIRIAPDTEVLSDPLDIRITREDDFIIRMYFRESTTIRSCLVTWHFDIWQSTHHKGPYRQAVEDHVDRSAFCPGLTKFRHPCQFAAGFSSVLVETDPASALLALFGDSITHMVLFSDPLIEKLYADFPGKIAVINCGIAGNRIARDYPHWESLPGEGASHGIAGKTRFYADAYKDAAPDIVFVMEGINDSTHSFLCDTEEPETPENIYDALCDIVKMARQKGSKVLVSTATPFGSNDAPWRSDAETIRCAYNDRIRKDCTADGFFDMDALLRDPEDIHHIQEGMHLGDYTHPNTFGGKKMAQGLYDSLLQPFLTEMLASR